MFRLGLGGRCSPLLTAFHLFLSVHVAASGRSSTPDLSAEVWSVVFSSKRSTRRPNRLRTLASVYLHGEFDVQVSPSLKNFCRSVPFPDLLHLISPLWCWAPIHNTWSAVWMTLGAGSGGNAASDWPVIAANRILYPKCPTCGRPHHFARMVTLSQPRNRLVCHCLRGCSWLLCQGFFVASPTTMFSRPHVFARTC